MNPLFFADLHVHPGMKPSHSLENGVWDNMWKEYAEIKSCGNPLLDCAIKEMTKYSQTNLQKCFDSNVLLLFNALYPVELPWFDMRDIGKFFIGKNRRKKIARCLTNFSEETLENMFFEVIEKDHLPVNYFNRLEREYYFVERESMDISRPMRILIDFMDYKLWKAKNLQGRAGIASKEIGLILCVEGAHSLLSFPDYKTMIRCTADVVKELSWENRQLYQEMLTANIRKMKSWGNRGTHAPLYITFSHHFWNLLAGHASSIDIFLLNQSEGKNETITFLGEMAISLLLERTVDGRRILIDMKHFSPIARKRYYEILDELNFSDVPILASHAAVTGIDSGSAEKHEFFNTADINLFNEDILKICTSDGLIGIMMEEGRLVNKSLMKKIKNNYGSKSPAASKFYAKCVLANILHIVQIAGSDGWNHVCLGSDFDGMINSLDSFDSVSTYNDLFKTIRDVLDGQEPIEYPGGAGDDVYAGTFTRELFSIEDINGLKHGYTTDQLINKLAYQNIEYFLSRYFHDQYLKLLA